MTGPEHYREAERLIASLPDDPERWSTTRVALAQAHATLALVAAIEKGSTPPDFCGVIG